MPPDPFVHPDLNDPGWTRAAERRARRERRKIRRRQVALWGPRRARGRYLGPTALVVAVLVVAVGGIHLIGATRDQPSGSLADQPGVRPVDPDRPFARTPAADWDHGADGIVVPEAADVGDFDAASVRAAFERVRDVLVATRIERGLVEDGEIAPALSLVAPSEREWARSEFDRDVWPITLATRVHPDTPLLPVDPKVRGSMVAAAGERPGELEIRTDYVFAYAFDTDDPDALSVPLDIVSMYRAQVTYVLREGDRWYAEDRGLAFGDSEAFFYSMACAPLLEQGLLAPAYREPARPGLPDEKRPPEYFDPDAPMPDENNCGTEV
ncbi:hypothetical protein [Saccharomonospora iraqiensis]|uniref:hypothetical protein n=1 Tax=Saccharomonospora iraqiensis TaxID=52698 RepID=UPI00022DF521|nr:hypothetical protein [Saccharomonospora iraqiensis]